MLRNTEALTTLAEMDGMQFLRLSQIVGSKGLLPISRSTFYSRIKNGKIPPPIKLGARISVWRAVDILNAIENYSVDGGGHV